MESVHGMLLDAGGHRGKEDVWRLVMAQVSLDGGHAREDAAEVYLNQVELDAKRRRGREALVAAAHRMETARDPDRVLVELAQGVAE